jgi:hypothetical protein
MRITGLAVSNEDVNTRRLAVSDLRTSWAKLTATGQLIAKAADIAAALGGDGAPPASLGNEVQGAVQNHASAFLYSDRPLEVGICAGMAFVDLAKPEPGVADWTTVDLLATALWLALDFQPALQEQKREDLRREVLDVARCRSVEAAEKARERSAVGDFLDLVVTIGEENKVTTNFKKAVSGTIEALRRNAALDREELDFLWWSQLGRSRILNKPLSVLSEPVRLVASGIEAAGYLRRLPCEVHRDVLLRSVDADTELDLGQLLDAIGTDRPVLSKGYTEGIVVAAPAVFPLLSALASGSAQGMGSTEKRPASTWGGRALLEAALAQIIARGLAKL